MKVLYKTCEVTHKEMQERIITESKSTGPTPSKEITCHSCTWPEQQLHGWRQGAGGSCDTQKCEQMRTDTYFLLTVGKSYYAFAPLPQLTSQKCQFQKFKQPLWFPTKKWNNWQNQFPLARSGFFGTHCREGKRGFSHAVKIFWHITD